MVVDIVPLALIVERLAKDPFLELGLPRSNRFYDGVKPQRTFWNESRREWQKHRDSAYDAPRVRYFRDRYATDTHVEAIFLKIDSKGRFHVGNGWHRLAAAMLAGAERIRVRFAVVAVEAEEGHRKLEELRHEIRARKAA